MAKGLNIKIHARPYFDPTAKLEVTRGIPLRVTIRLPLDRLHRARLVGLYHSRRALGPPYYREWFDSLSLAELDFIRAYVSFGRLGELDPEGQARPGSAMERIAAAQAAGALGAAMAGLGPAMGRAREAFETAGRALSQGLVDRLPDNFDYLEMRERIVMRLRLQRLFIPAQAAIWLARQWPRWALPGVIGGRIGGVLLRFSKWLGGLTNGG